MRVGLQLLYPRQRLLGGDPGSHALLFTYVFLPASPFLGVVRLREPTREYLVYVYVAPGSHPGYQVSSKFSGGDAVFSHGVLERLDEPELEFLHVGVTHPVQDMGLHVRVKGVVMLVFLVYLEDAQHPVHRVLYGHVVVHEALHGLRKVSGVGVEQRSAHGGRMLLEPSGVRSTHGAQKLAFPQGGSAQRSAARFRRPPPVPYLFSRTIGPLCGWFESKFFVYSGRNHYAGVAPIRKIKNVPLPIEYLHGGFFVCGIIFRILRLC